MDFARFENVTLTEKRRPLLSDLKFSIFEGEFFGILGGPSSGKTTLLRALLGIIKPRHGEIAVHVRPGEASILPEGGFVNLWDTPGVLRFGYVPHADSVDESFPLTALQIVRLCRLAAMGAWHRPNEQDEKVVLDKLKLLGVFESRTELYRSLPTDQKQRVLLARALVAEARVLVLDEPLESMTQENRRTTIQLLEQLYSQGGLTVVYATKREEELPRGIEHVLVIGSGRGRVVPRGEMGVPVESLPNREPEAAAHPGKP